MMRSLPARTDAALHGVRPSLRAVLCALLALGSATAAAPCLKAQTTQPASLPVVIADFNHDGIPDVLVPSNNGATATIALGTTPYGTFSTPKGVTFPSTCNRLFPNLSTGQLSVGDFNGDGFPDLFFTCGGASTGVMLGNGDGTFATPVLLSGATSVSAALVGDFDHDGKTDLALIGSPDSGQSTGILFYKGNGDGTFAEPVYSTFGSASNFFSTEVVNGATTADINGDGYSDLLINGQLTDATKTLSVFGNNKDGTFGTASQATRVPNTTAVLGNGPAVTTFTILPANIYGSGLPDIVFSNSGTTPGVLILKNTSTATSYSFASLVSQPYTGFQGAQVGDFAGTLFSDLAIFNGTSITVFANDGSGNFTANYAALAVSSTSSLFSVADANADGYSDIYMATSPSAGGLQLAVNLVSGTATATSQPFSLGIGTKAVSATWPGNVNLAGSTATGTQIVNGAAPSAVISSSKNPSLVGDAVTFTVAVTSAVASTLIPSGSLILQDNGTMLTNSPLDNTGKLVYTTSALSQGTHAITAIYGGDSYFAGATSPALSQVVNHAAAVAPTLTWADPAAIAYGTSLSGTQLDAIATDASGSVVPGTFAYTPAAGAILNVGLQTLSVVFTPNDLSSFLTATKSVSLNVLQVSPTVTLALSSGGNAVTMLAAGSTLKLTATVNSTGTSGMRGQVNFCDAAAPYCTDIHFLGTAQLTSGGTATISLVPAIGAHSYKAVFLGTKNAVASVSAPSAVTVTGKYQTATTVAQTGTVGNYTLTATTIGSGSSTVAPTGAVSFLDQSNGNAVLASARLGAATRALTLVQSASPPTGREAQFIAIADFNGDGRLDLAVANQGAPGVPSTGRTISILLGKGDGTFTAAQSPATGNGPTSIAVADFNGDGFADLAVTNFGDNTISLLLGNGDGTFRAASTASTGAGPYGIATGDFNSDGSADLIVTNSTANTITVLLSNGDGTFTAAASAPATGVGPQGIVVGDFNADGKADVATANTGGSGLTVLLGNGDGTFTAGGSSGSAQVTGGTLPQLSLADFNGDGKLDLVVASQTNGTLTGAILLGNGDGTFTNASGLGSDPTDSFALAVRDFNGDGNSDIVVVDNHGTTLLLGNGDGTFAPGANVQAANDASFESVAIADFNGDGIPDIASANSDDDLVTILLTQVTQTVTATATGVSPLGTGTHQVIASYPSDTSYAASVSQPTSLSGSQIAPTLNWIPAVSSIVYGTPLGAQQLNAVVTGPNGVAVNGIFTYLPAAGTVLTVGRQVLNVSFAPTDPTFIPVSGTATITVTPAAPVLTWATPSSIAYGIPLSATQLNASVVGVAGAALPGTFTYTPAAGTVLAPGTQTLTVRFVPTDAIDYTIATRTVNLLITGVTLTSVTPSTAILGDGDKTVTLVGSGFVSTSVVQVNGTAIAATLVNPTTLTAVIPAANFAKIGSLLIVVVDPNISLTSSPLTITVAASSPSVTLGGPSTTAPGSQPSLSLSINNPYPVELTAVFNLAFAPAVTPAIDDPAIQFANGLRTFTFIIPANSTAVPPILLQSGTVAGTITIPLTLTAGGSNVTPANLQPVVIVIPPAVPMVSTTTVTRNGSQLSVAIHGFSNTREVTQATFHFVGIGGAQIDTPDIVAPIGPLFTGWFGSTTSAQYGSTFTYTQVFNVSDNAANIGTVQVTLTNSVGVSVSQTAQ